MTQKAEGSKPFARMRLHGPGMVFDWHQTYQEAANAIDDQERRYPSGNILKFTVIGYFKHLDDGENMGKKGGLTR